GRATFADLLDGSGRIQVMFRRNQLPDTYEVLNDLDIGDWLGVKGPIFRTRAGEITLEVGDFTLLCKSLRPLPEKWHGLSDVETRFRQRYLDLIANEQSRKSAVLSAMRRFMEGRGFIEVETPTLVPIAAGAMAQPFVTHHNTLGRDLYLRIATELYLKRLVVGGLEKVYEIGKVFRNEGLDL
ncbi:MAG: amino acid--tRNA ligase-related protein, partial [Dehalococcoidia bacterium]|nr:amino acid--tRNA ligase-related protein [Dehalococcoidia bacterium]